MKKWLMLSLIGAVALLSIATVVYFAVPSLHTPSESNPGSSGNNPSGTIPNTSSSNPNTNPGSTLNNSPGTNPGTSPGTNPGTTPSTPPVVPAGSAGPAAVNLGTAGDFVILANTGISTTGTTAITGDIGTGPGVTSTAITGFALTLVGTYSTSALVTGKIYAYDYDVPTPAKMNTASLDMGTAFTDAAGRTNPTATELGAGNIDGMTLAPGLYKWGTGLTIPTGVTLNCQGNSNAVFIFQISQDLTVGNGAIITLSGCQAKNIFWQVGGQAILGTTSNFKGNILSQTLIDMQTGATLNGRALAQTAVTLDANSVTKSN